MYFQFFIIFLCWVFTCFNKCRKPKQTTSFLSSARQLCRFPYQNSHVQKWWSPSAGIKVGFWGHRGRYRGGRVTIGTTRRNSCGKPQGRRIYTNNGDRGPVYVALDTKPLGTVRHLPIQRATAVVNGWDFPTKLAFHIMGGVHSH